MSTQLWSANIILGTDSNQHIIEKIGVKRLPLNVLISDSYFIDRLKNQASDATWKRLPKSKETGLPSIKIIYLKYLGEVGEDPKLTI